jgi:hypothetical protein
MAEESKGSRSGLSCLLVGLALCGIVVIALFCPFPFERGIRNAQQLACENNLMQLWTLAHVYAQQFGGEQGRFPEETGKAFWLKLTETKPPLLAGDELEVLICPDSEEIPRLGFTTYRGPGRDVNTMSGKDVVGCCGHVEHPDGSVFLRKDGSIVILKGDKAKLLMAQVKD